MPSAPASAIHLRQLASPISHLICNGGLAGVVAVDSLFKVTAVTAGSRFKAAAVAADSLLKAATRLVAAVALISAAALWTRFAIVAPDMKGFAAIASADRAFLRG